MGTVSDLPSALLTGLAAGLVTLTSALPGILAAAIILVAGWIITAVIAKLVARALGVVHADDVAQRTGLTDLLRRAQVTAGLSALAAGVVKWYLRLVVVLMAAEAVGLSAIGTIVNQVMAFVPNLIVAALILAAFSWLAARARSAVTAALEPTMPNAHTIGVLAYAATFGFGTIAAATQIGIATSLIEILFAGIVVGLALAFGLAFGLGGRDEAALVWKSWRATATPPSVAPSPSVLHAEAAGNGRPQPQVDLIKA